MSLLILALSPLSFWLTALNIVAFASMGLDKALARGARRRTSERSIWVLAFAGGFLGVLAGAIAFHHKTSKASFWPPVALAALAWIGLFYLYGAHL
ncbi:MAG: DUF1294 domain-containing protein [archaeon]|nr:MAG: DUF1294 domain-containing protein [archaeon]